MMGRAWLRYVAVGAAVVTPAWVALPADGETEHPSGTGATTCQALATGKPTRLTAGVGATQSTRVGTRFPLRLAVTVTDAEKNPVAGVPVTFVAPARGPSGRLTTGSHSPRGMRSRTSHPRRVKVRSNACGIALAPVFVANHRQGGYIVVASVQHLRAAFALVNEGP
jgi:hypothetical protein